MLIDFEGSWRTLLDLQESCKTLDGHSGSWRVFADLEGLQNSWMGAWIFKSETEWVTKWVTDRATSREASVKVEKEDLCFMDCTLQSKWQKTYIYL